MTLNVYTNNGIISFDKLKMLIKNDLWIARNCAMTVDGIAMFYMESANKEYIFAINIYAKDNAIIYDVSENKDIQSSMSSFSYRKFITAYKNNINMILNMQGGVIAHA